MPESHRGEQKTSGEQKPADEDVVAALRVVAVRVLWEWSGECRASDQDRDASMATKTGLTDRDKTKMIKIKLNAIFVSL